MKKLLLLTLLFSVSAFADLYKLIPGTYYGKTNYKNKRANLFLTDYPGREGSFLAVIMSKDKRAFAYLVDKYAPNTYGMIPLQVMKNGVVGLTNPNPSLNLKLTIKGRRRFIQVIDSGELNNIGFNQSIIFEYDNESHKQRLGNIIPGSYKYDSRKEVIAIGSQDHNNEAFFTANTEVLSGDFVLREVRPGLHLPLRSVLKNTGIEVSDNADGMAIFIDKECIFGVGTRMIYFGNNGHVELFKRI